jgi:E3 ubiquitin-protein ligase BOI-like protein
MLQGVTMAAMQQPRFAGGLAAGYLVPPCDGVEQMMWALKDHEGNDGWYQYHHDCAAAQSDLTCNAGGGDKVVVRPSLKRCREDDDLARYCAAPSSSALLPIPGMAQSATASTSGRPATPIAAAGRSSVEDALVAEMCGRQAEEIDAVVRAECDRLRAGLERARKRRCVALVRAAAAAGARALRDREVELNVARRRAAELEERVRQAAAEGQAWRDVARGNEAVAAGLRATLETLLLGGAGAGTLAVPSTTTVLEEGFGDSGDPNDARSCCFVEAEAGAGAAAATSSAAVSSRWECRACGGGEASVLLLPCRHLCLCKACEPRVDACPVCLDAKTGAIHVAAG